MRNIFDAIGNTTFDIIKNFAGYSAKWSPSNNGPQQTAIVLYKGPTDKYEMNESKFDIEKFQIEFYETNFIGLYESVSESNNEDVQIELSVGVFTVFHVKRCQKKYDGKSIIAFLTPSL